MQAPTQDRELRKDDLPVLEQRVLEELTRSRFTTTAVMLAADLWNPQRRSDWSGDPVGLIGDLLASLNEMGLVRYTEGKSTSVGNHDIYAGFPIDIRLTPAGWELCGFPTKHLEAGSRIAQRAHLHGPDRTNYRNHSDHAQGGPIEVDTFEDHKVLFPHHFHRWLWTSEEYDVMTRGYVKVTGELEGEVLGIRARNPAASIEEIAETAGVPKRTVQYILTELPKLRRLKNGEDQTSASLKQRIVWCLEEGEFPDVKSLRLILGRADTDHDIVHVLHSLHKEGRVDFDEDKAADAPIRIRLRKRSNKPVLKSVPRVEEPEQEAAQDASTPSQLDPGPQDYPILAALLEREAARSEADRKALQYIEAADILRDTDPETAALLLQKSEEHNTVFPSPIEQEYFRYAKSHGTD